MRAFRNSGIQYLLIERSFKRNLSVALSIESNGDPLIGSLPAKVFISLIYSINDNHCVTRSPNGQQPLWPGDY